MKCILFDHDGTLMNSMASVAEATNRTLIHYGFQPREAGHILKDLSSRTSERVSRLTGITDPRKVEEVTKKFYKILCTVSEEMTRPYPGMVSLVEALTNEGFVLGIVSNSRGDVVRKVIEANGLNAHFQFILGEEDFKTHKPAPDGLLMGARMAGFPVEECFYIGDGMPDYLAARAAGMKAGMVSWGHLSREELAGLSPDHAFHSSEEIMDLLIPTAP